MIEINTVKDAMLGQYLSYNDAATREKITASLTEFLITSTVKIVCNETNNPPEVVEANHLIVDIDKTRYTMKPSEPGSDPIIEVEEKP